MKISDLIRSLQYRLEQGGDTTVAFLLGFKDDFEYASGVQLSDEQWLYVAEDFCANAYIDARDMSATVEIVLEQLEREAEEASNE